MKRTGECPICGSAVSLNEHVVLNELVNCMECDSELEISCLAPLELIEAPAEEEDWGE